LRLKGKSTVEEVGVVQKDMPNFFLEAVTVADGRLHTEMKEVVVPPEKRVLNVEVLPSQKEDKPGQKATVKVRLTDFFGKPFLGSTVLSVYDKSVEYVSGGSNVPEIKEFFWKWRRHHHPQTESSLAHWFGNLLRRGEVGMSDLGVFGALVTEEVGLERAGARGGAMFRYGAAEKRSALSDRAPGGERDKGKDKVGKETEFRGRAGAPARPPAPAGEEGAPPPAAPQAPPPPGAVEPAVRKNFADTAFWAAALATDRDGVAEVSLTMPENLTCWKVK